MGIASSSKISQLLNISLPKAELTMFYSVIARKLRHRFTSFRLYSHTSSITHNLTQGSLKPNHAIEFAYQHELQDLNIHFDDGGDKTRIFCFALEQDENFINSLLATQFLEN